MKHTVRLQRGLYVLVDSYARPTFPSRIRQHFPIALCLTSILVAGITLQVIEQRTITACQTTHRASF